MLTSVTSLAALRVLDKPTMADVPLNQRPAPTAAETVVAKSEFPAPAPPLNSENFGWGVQRTMKLLATSTPQRRNTVRILFYGQSITNQNWTKIVSEDLRKRFPHANLIIENRSIGGFSSQILWKTAEFDLYSFYPDLVIFHVYGSHSDYERIIRNIRTRTTAEVLMQTDHINTEKNVTEETDPAKLAPNNWEAWFNHVFLPETAKKYNVELLDQRAEWKRYLTTNNLKPSQLLSDGVHLNDWGNYAMAEFVKAHLRYDPKFSDAPHKDLVREYKVGTDIKWTNGKLTLPFEGNRVDVIASPTKNAVAEPLRVLIDGKKPSQIPELYAFTRPSGTPHIGWPGVIHLTSQAPLQVEDWTARVYDINEDATKFKFDITGSKTGADGSGTSDAKFVSKSGRIVIEPEDWWLNSDYKLSKKPTPEGYEIKWRVVPQSVDEYTAPQVQDATIEYSTTLAQGLSNGKHTLELVGNGKNAPAISTIRVYTPPVK
jgi:hypothetical protein